MLLGYQPFYCHLGDTLIKVEAHPKDFSLLSARIPITVGGTLKNPSIGLDPKELAVHSNSAAALGVLFFHNPLH
jgi:hypothetical protein